LFAVESAFTLPWNSCSFCRGIPVHFGVEYSGIALISGRQHIDGVSPMLRLAETFLLAFFRWRIWSCAFPAAEFICRNRTIASGRAEYDEPYEVPCEVSDIR
ncbi:hypothetical protein P3T23_009815, partial [Paraburkholderia sp. GAS448]|uniref:hypothetical protein n=1 Tax=Paraburkholderia sp. GAS448 TaxID=3035136 RepID=UPI003D1B96D5